MSSSSICSMEILFSPKINILLVESLTLCIRNSNMENIKDFIKSIIYATPKELSEILGEVNRRTFQDSEGDERAVRAYNGTIKVDLQKDYEIFATAEKYPKPTPSFWNGEMYLVSMQGKANLEIAYNFVCNPPVVENPNKDGLKVDVEAITLDKPVYTTEEVRTLLGVGESTFRKWINGGWISYTQMNGSDKKFIQKEHLLEFLNNPKIFYPSSK